MVEGFRPKRLIQIFIFLLSATVLFNFLASYQRPRIAKSWDQILPTLNTKHVAELQSAFSAYQTDLLLSVRSICSDSSVRNQLSRGDSADVRAIFESLIAITPAELSIEIYSPQKLLVAWQGMSGPPADTSLMKDSPTSLVVDEPIYSYLIVVVPLPTPQGKQWYGVGKRLLDVNYPISNRFINNTIFSSTFTSEVSSDVWFEFNGDTPTADSGNFVRARLLAIDSSPLGYAYIPQPALESYVESSLGIIDISQEFALLLACIVLTFLLGGAINWKSKGWGRCFLLTLLIWSARYALLWMDVPQRLFPLQVFEPTTFASPFGFGLAHSNGDLFLSAIFLLWNVMIVSSTLARGGTDEWASRKIPTASSRLLAILLVVFGGVVICLMIRGFVATIHSAVFDSTILYNDPTFILPAPDLGVMLMSLGAIAFAIVMMMHAFVGHIVARWGASFPSFGIIATYVAIGLLFAIVSIIFGWVQPHPLLTQAQRMTVLLGLLMFSFIKEYSMSDEARIAPIILNMVVSIILVVPILDKEVHRLDRTHVELLTSEIIHPTDHWLNVVVNQALDQLADNEAAAILSSHQGDDIKKLAFTQWARSILSREGNTCSIKFLNENGEVVSEFHIGVTPYMNREPMFEIAPTKRYIDLEPSAGRGDYQWHRGYSPIYSDSGAFCGGVLIELSSGRGTLLRDDAPEVLKNYSREHFETHFRKLEISEYDNDTLLSSTNERLPRGMRLPALITTSQSSQWVDETIDSQGYESYYFPQTEGDTGGTWLSISLEGLDLRWHVYTYLRYMLFYLVALTIIGALGLSVLFLRKKTLAATFQMKLMAAFVVVSLLPILIVAYYNRAYAIERSDAGLTKKLQETTSLLVAQLERQERVTVPSELAKLSNDHCTNIADQLDADFNVYNGVTLQASSKPEIFAAELMDVRLSASALVALYLANRNFITQNESIGALPYIVGYRPIRSESGAIIGVLSMPTLFRQSEVDLELTRRNVFLFGAYAIALIIIVLMSMLFARQIAAPITRLRAMTARVAGGDFTARIESRRTDEIGELENAFNEMTRNIQETQEEKLKAQRELAWKDMAKQVAHEIKNPLTPIKLSLQHLQRAYTDGAENFGDIFRQVTRTVLEQIETLNRITSEFAQFARMPERTISECHVHEILNDVIGLYAQHPAMRWRNELFAARDTVSADREELRRALMNIIRNSVQATGYKGEIVVRTFMEGNILVMMIVDDGPGIPGDVQQKLFTPNFSTKTDGMGLGLSIVKKAIEDAGGSITIESSVGKGTAAVIRLPLA